MTQAEAMVYAAAFAERGAVYAAQRVLVLREEYRQPAQKEVTDMLAEFRAFGHDGSGARGGKAEERK